MNRYVLIVLGAMLLGAMTPAGAAPARDNWPQWRGGPEHGGLARPADPPVTWSESENIRWKTALPSWSGSSPIVWGDKVFVMSPSKPDPAVPQEQESGGRQILLICLNKADGKRLWEQGVALGNELKNKQNYSSPTPATDGTHVWTLTGSGILTALDMAGEIVWQKDLQAEYGPFGQQFGYASSPLLYQGRVIVQVLHGFTTDAPSYMAAFDGLTGAAAWREERPSDAVKEAPDAYNTPTLVAVDGKMQLVASGSDCVTGHDPQTGKEIWRVNGLNPKNDPYNRIIASATAADGMVYAPSRKKPLLAIRAGGTGDVTTTNTVWKWDRSGGPDVPTPICDGKYFYMADDRGYATCLDAKTGQIFWGPEKTAPGTVSASPMLFGDRLYITNEEAVTSVLAAGPEFKMLATNKLDGANTLSSLAIANNQLFLRTNTHLYCIATPEK